MAARIAAFDWSATPLGPLANWRPHLRNTVSLMLRSDVPMVLLWGADGVMIYNDSYSEFAGGRNSRLLGSRVREGWDEVAEFNDNVMRVGLAGNTLRYKNHELTLHRNGGPEQVVMDLDYSPVLDDNGVPAGVIAIVIETTDAQRTRKALEASEGRLRFLDSLGRAVAEARDADDILTVTTRMTAEHLLLSNCAYADMDGDQDGFTIRGNWHAPDSPSILGRYRLTDFGTRAVQDLRAGRALILKDVREELPSHEAKTFEDMGIAAAICIPLVKQGRLTALMAIHDRVPRDWSDYDLTVIREVTERSWAHVERVRSEQAVLHGHALLRRSQEAGGVGLFSVDVETGVVSCTPQFCRIFGFSERDFISAAEIEPLVLPEDADIVSNAARRRAGIALLDIEYRIRRADTGEERIIARKGEYERDEIGNPLRLVGAVQDVTERYRLQSALEKSEAGFSALAEFMPNQVWTARADGALDWFNGRVYSYFGATQGSLDGDGWTRVIHSDDLPSTIARWSAAVETGENYETEFRLRGAEGGYRWFLARAVALRDSGNRVTAWVGTNTDIHDQKMLEAASTRDR
ncbi:MAG: PAS domain-containing protein, partial [Sphingobium sp.]